jgi:hypothetical protein
MGGCAISPGAFVAAFAVVVALALVDTAMAIALPGLRNA